MKIMFALYSLVIVAFVAVAITVGLLGR